MAYTTRWTVRPVAWIPIALAIGAESLSNAMRAYDLGTHLQMFTVDSVSIAGSVFVAAAIAVSFTQARCAWTAITSTHTWQRIVSGVIAGTCLLMSIYALHTHINNAILGKSGDERTAAATYDRAAAAYKQASDDFAKVKGAPTVEAVTAQMDAIQINPAIRLRTKGCSEISLQASQDECAPVLKLKPLLADAQRKAELEARLPELKAELDKLNRPEVSNAADMYLWSWIFGLCVVGIATFGAVIFGSAERVPEIPDLSRSQSANRPPPPPKGKSGRKADERILNFSDAFKKANGRQPNAAEIRAYFPEIGRSTAYDYVKRQG